MPKLTVEFSPVPRKAGQGQKYSLHYRNSDGNYCTSEGTLRDDCRVTFDLPGRLAFRSENDAAPNDGDLVSITAGSDPNTRFDAKLRLPQAAHARLSGEPKGQDATIRVIPCLADRLIPEPDTGTDRQKVCAADSNAPVFLRLFRGTVQLEPKLMQESGKQTPADGQEGNTAPKLIECNKPKLIFRDGCWGIELRPESFGSPGTALSVGRSLWLVPAAQEVSEKWKAIALNDPNREDLRALNRVALQVLSITLGEKTENFWFRQDQTVHLPLSGGSSPQTNDLNVRLKTLAGSTTPVRTEVGADGVVALVGGGRIVVDKLHPLYLVLDFGASTHLCGLHALDARSDLPAAGAGTTFLHIGPTGLGPDHASEETPGIVYSLSPATRSAASINDPLWYDRGAALAELQRDHPLRVAIGNVTAQDAAERLSSVRRLTDLKWLLHLAPREKLAAQFGLDREGLVRAFVENVGHRCKAALQSIPTGTLDPNAGDDAPLLALVMTLPGYLRCDIYEALLGHLGDLGSSLNRQTRGLAKKPEDHFGRVYMVPEPFALMASWLEDVASDTRSVVTLDVGMRTFDAARVDRGADGTGRFPRRCLSANLGGRAMDYAILAALREACAPGEGPALGLLAIDDAEMLRRFKGEDRTALAAGEAMLRIVEAAKCGMKDGVLTFNFAGQVETLGHKALGSLFQALQARVEPGGDAMHWQIRWAALAGTPAMTAFMAAVGAMVDDCLADLPAGGPALLQVGGRGSRFPPLRRVIEARARQSSGLKLDFLGGKEAAEGVILGAARLAADRSLLVGRVEPTFFLVHLPIAEKNAPLVQQIPSIESVTVGDAGRVFVAAVGPAMARAIAESADPEAMCRIFFQGESVDQALPVGAGEAIVAEVLPPVPDSSQIVRLTCGRSQQDFAFLRPGGLFA